MLSCSSDKQAITELFPVETGAKYSFIDRGGNISIPGPFSKASCFAEGVALVATSDTNMKWGFIDKTGNFVISPHYSSATTFSEGVAFVVTEEGVPMAIDRNGATQFSLDVAVEVANFSEGLAAYSIHGAEGELWGFVDKEGKTVIQPSFRDVSYFSEGLCGAMNEKGQWGYIGRKGETKIEFRYDNVHPFKGKYAKVSLRGNWGIVNAQGREIIAPQYADIDVDGEQYLVKQGDKWGWINKVGKATISAQYDNAFPFRGSKYAAVKQGNKWGYIDEHGKMIINPVYDFAFGFDGDVAVVETGSKYGLIGKEGNFIAQPVYDNISLDYFIKFFAKTSEFYSLQTNKNTPENIAWKWLSHFYHLEYKDAMKMSTQETNLMLSSFGEMTNMVADTTKQRMGGIIVGIKDAKVSDDRAIVTYMLSDNPGKEQLLFLVRKDGKWLVQFTKNDAPVAAGPAGSGKNGNSAQE